MYTNQPKKHDKNWTKAWVITLVVHIILFGCLAWFLLPSNLVHVVNVVPLPGEVVDLLPNQGLRPTVHFSKSDVRLESAHLCLVDDDGKKVSCVKAEKHDELKNAIVFEPVHTPGNYELVIDEDAFDAPLMFDGEFLGSLPSGDSKPGGAFRMLFNLNEKKEEIVTASVFDVTKPLVNEADRMKTQKSNYTAEVPIKSNHNTPRPPKNPNKPNKTNKPNKPNKTNKEVNPPPADFQSPEISAPNIPIEEATPEPSPVKLSPQMFAVTPLTISPTLLLESAEKAEAIFEERDKNVTVAEVALAQDRFNKAYNNGPVVGIGERGDGNAVALDKDVAEYLALMHKEIHPRWGDGYLVQLDRNARNLDKRLQDASLEAIMEITLEASGKVIDVRVVKSTGLPDYDAEAINVAWKSSANLPVPEVMRSKDGKSYIHWTFWRDEKQCGVYGVRVYKLNRGRRENIDFDLKKVGLMEEKLGIHDKKKAPSSSSGQIPFVDPVPIEPEPIKGTINPLDD